MRKFAFGRFFLFLIVGFIVGTALGLFVGKVFPIFSSGIHAGIPSFSLDLVFLKLNFGIEIELNVGTIIGVVVFVLLFTLT
uniref:DUF4321 domain-containing protein n=1 Tax=Caldisericum exile TaxID=693075 RepID=A0A7C4Y3S7_9BACT